MVLAAKLRSIAFAALAASAGCATTGNFVWVDDYPVPPTPPVKEYQFVPGDTLSVRVFNQDAMSGRARVRADGKVSMPFLGDLDVAGRTTVALQHDIEKRLTSLINKPIVTVALEEPRAFVVYVVGEVVRPGSFTLDTGASVLQAVAAAGGLTPYAGRDRLYVVRQDPEPARIRFRYEALTRAEGRAAGFKLKNGDIVVAE